MSSFLGPLYDVVNGLLALRHPTGVVVVIDALDEARTSYVHDGLVFPDTVFPLKGLGEGTAVVMSIRSTAGTETAADLRSRLRLPNLRHIALPDLDEEAVQQLFRRSAVPGLKLRSDDPAFVSLVHQKTRGLAIYLRALEDELSQTSEQQWNTVITSLPRGFAEFVGQAARSVSTKPQWRDALRFLSMATDPLSGDDLLSLTELAGNPLQPEDLDAVPWDVQRWLQHDQAGWLFQHQAIADAYAARYLTDSRPQYLGYLRAYCARWGEHRSRYALAHYASFLNAGMRDTLHNLIGSVGGPISFPEVRLAVEGSYDGYLADLRLAWDRAGEEDINDPVTIGRQVRYALIQSTTASDASNAPVALILALMRHGIWDGATAMNHVLRIPDAGVRTKVLAQLGKCLSEDGQQRSAERAFELSLSTADTIVYKADRADALAGLIAYIPAEIQPDVADRVLPLINEIDDEELRSSVVARMAPSLPTHLISAFLAKSLWIQDGEARVQALVALLLRDRNVNLQGLSPLERKNAVDEVVKVVVRESHLWIGDSVADILGAVMSLVPPHKRTVVGKNILKQRMLEPGDAPFIASIMQYINTYMSVRERNSAMARFVAKAPKPSSSWEAHIVGRLLQYSPPDQRRERVKEILEVLGRESLARVAYTLEPGEPGAHLVATVVSYIPADHLPEALAFARTIRRLDVRSCMVVEIGRHLPPEHTGDLMVAMREILQEVSRLSQRKARAEVVAMIAPHLPAELLQEALLALRVIGNAEARVQIRVALLPHLSPEQREGVAREVLNLLQSRIIRAEVRAWVVAMALPHIPTDVGDSLVAVLKENLLSVHGLNDKRIRARIIAEMAPLLPAELVPYALAELHDLQGSRAEGGLIDAMIALIPRLSPELRSDNIARVLRMVDELERFWSPFDSSGILAAIVPYMDPEQRAPVVARALARYCDAPALAALVPYMSPSEASKLVDHALVRAMGRLIDIDSEANAVHDILALLPHLPRPRRDEAVSAILRHIRDWNIDERGHATALLTPYLAPNAVPATVLEACVIKDPDLRVEALSATLQAWQQLSHEQASSTWRRALRVIANQHRDDVLITLSAIASMIHLLGGSDGVSAVVRAIQDVEHWRP